MRVLVTGGAGFIGSCFVRSVFAGHFEAFAGAHVTVLDKLTYAGNLANLAAVVDEPGYAFAHGDIALAADLDAVLPSQDLVINFAAESHVDRSMSGPPDFVRTNVFGAQQLFEACLRHGVERVVHVSTDEVYGSVETGKAREDDPLRPNSLYAAAKASADLIARSYVVARGLDVRITRCANNYGPYQHPEKLVPRFVTNLLDGRRVPLYGTGAQLREWLHVSDHCRAVALVASEGSAGAIYNVGGGRTLANRDLTAMLLAATGRDDSLVEQVHDPRGAANDLRYALDDAKLAALGYVAQVDFGAGLAATVDWYRDHRDWWQPLVSSLA